MAFIGEVSKMIHKNVYSERMKKTEEFDPYKYEFKDKFILNSFSMFFSTIADKTTFSILAIKDFCETERIFISDITRNYILSNKDYNKDCLLFDLQILFMEKESCLVLDYLEICINVLNNELKNIKYSMGPIYYKNDRNYLQAKALKEYFVQSLNILFEHNNLGYEIINDIIVTKESDFLHVEVINKPLTLLINEEFNGPLKEFEDAIKNYTDKDYENTIVQACRAFESTMKAVLDKLEVTFDHDKSTASDLVNLLKQSEIFNSFQNYNIKKLVEILSSGLPVIRNRKGAHGEGIEINEAERSYASFALNLVGSNIVFILDRYYEKISENNK